MTQARSGARGAFRLLMWASLLGGLLTPSAAVSQDSAPAPAFQPGMAWTYRQRDEISGHEGAIRIEVIAVAPRRVTVGLAVAEGPAWNERWDADGNWEQVGTQGRPWLGRLGGASKRLEFEPPLPLYRFPLEAGKRWVEAVRALDPDSGRRTSLKVFAKAIAWEEVAVPAGKFRAIKVRRSIAPEDGDSARSPTTVTLIDWYAPQVGATVKRICDWEYHDLRRPVTDQLTRGPRLRFELTAYELAR